MTYLRRAPSFRKRYRQKEVYLYRTRRLLVVQFRFVVTVTLSALHVLIVRWLKTIQKKIKNLRTVQPGDPANLVVVQL